MSSDFFAEQLARIFIEQIKNNSKEVMVVFVKKAIIFPMFTVTPLLIHVKQQPILS